MRKSPIFRKNLIFLSPMRCCPIWESQIWVGCGAQLVFDCELPDCNLFGVVDLISAQKLASIFFLGVMISLDVRGFSKILTRICCKGAIEQNHLRLIDNFSVLPNQLGSEQGLNTLGSQMTALTTLSWLLRQDVKVISTFSATIQKLAYLIFIVGDDKAHF